MEGIHSLRSLSPIGPRWASYEAASEDQLWLIVRVQAYLAQGCWRRPVDAPVASLCPITITPLTSALERTTVVDSL
ncbi:hypothetical protein [Leptothermofonsia sp. ETS-13]|uniref:hypothetical protein n=1 Tax=Leptothermofonsia sp. ETS-13 TaxID=3035696 RepID=UPI003B9E53B8